MRPSAQLRGEVADPHHAHAVAVLLAEEGHGAGGQRVLDGHLLVGHRDVGLDLLVHQVGDLLDLPRLDGLAVGEVEAQMIGRHQRAGLGDVGAEHPAKRGVEQVRPRVVLANPEPARRFDAHRHVLALAEAARDHLDAVDDQLGAAIVRVDDLPAALAPDDGPRVADLAARLGVRGRAVEDHLHLVAGRDVRGRGAGPPPWPGCGPAR